MKDAFTLIELLLVVMIIAILAAIAIPNFLEAQTRSKIARAKSDMRSVATGIEAFRTDQNRYPPVNTESFLPRLIIITTPVAYLSSIPEDVFLVGMPASFSDFDWAAAFQIDGIFYHPFPFEYMLRPDDSYEGFPFSRPAIQWALKSAGPDRIPVWFFAPDVTAYDPTNGTTSPGDLIISGPGNQHPNQN
jgi:prepilin-type N-terminal cleavage/methylation domain-containing protein